MTVRVAVDFGTSSTCVVASVHGREPQVVVIDGHPLMSSAVYAAADGTLFVGQEAERQAAVDPSRYEPHPKRRIDEGELLLGDSVLRVTDVVHAVLARAVTEARRIAGDAEVDLLVLTHPAEWGAIRTRLLRQAAGGLAREVALVPEPVAAAVYHAATFTPGASAGDRTVEFSGRPGDVLAVLDLGGGTVDVSVVRRLPDDRAARGAGGPAPGTGAVSGWAKPGAAVEPGAGRPPSGPGDRADRRATGAGPGVPARGGFQVLATRGDPGFGGADIDQALLEHLGSLVPATDTEAWRQLVEGRELTDRRRRRVLRQDIRGAKETLSRHVYTDVPLPPPFADAHVTREDLERLIAAPLGRAVELTSAAIAEAGLRPKQLKAIFLVGGSSRIPMISRLVHERTGVVPTSLDQPETVVARGALRAVLTNPDRSATPPGPPNRPGAPVGRRDQPGPRTEIVRPVDPSHEGPADGRTELPSRPGRPPSGPTPVVRPPSPGRSGYGAPGSGGHPATGSGPAGGPAPGPESGRGPALGGGPGSAGGPMLGSGPGSAGGSALGSGPGSAGGSAPAGAPGPSAAGPGGRPSWAPSSARAEAETKGGERSSKLWWAVGPAAVVVLIVGLVVFLVNRPGEPTGPPPGRTYAQYDFSFAAPEDWVQTDDQVAQRQVILHPQESAKGNDLVVAQEYVMDYDATADRQRLVTALGAKAAGQAEYSGFDPGMTYGGRTVIGYRETKGDQLAVDWYVVVQGKFRVHVGCQYNAPALQQRIAAACEQVVRTLKITS
ncbi:type VII secretion-associated protein [Amycolatopsis sp. PS_44_ISF1]|uniref:type VII secretion-associated protein n=1 Tax=Amycolatopsis sp. PS_44_ISF1 TaxID=2974917 RepID=UPI0028E022AB|nr:type VII secretion-associated protein [Amycolatopsis sp. PS_44_ISF1]MDT8909695.1 type VII secretion-associated protein [Amycolatopsis sp. PS_44_ISF1]